MGHHCLEVLLIFLFQHLLFAIMLLFSNCFTRVNILLDFLEKFIELVHHDVINVLLVISMLIDVSIVSLCNII